jgi:hypothetical protein
MNMPGFTAEISLPRIKSNYRAKGVLSGRGAVVPQLRISVAPGCGECTSLKWPDGTPTGACARACCDALGRCSTETCPCGGGGIFGGGGGGVFRW